MPKLRIGTIPVSRLSDARRVRDVLTSLIGDSGYALVSIQGGGYSVLVRLWEGETIPLWGGIVEGVPVKITHVKKPA